MLQGVSPAQNSVGMSVIVPVRLRGPHDAGDLRACLAALGRCSPAPDEIIVVDDGSTPPIGPIAGAPATTRLLRLPPSGPAQARNAGAAAAAHGLLVFVDSDVVVPIDALGRLAAALEADPGAAAAWGTVQADHPDRALWSRYKNHSHRHFTLRLGQGPGPWPTPHLTTMLAAVRRGPFEAVGGFRAALQTVSIEDVELGRDLVDAGHRVLLDPGLEVRHAHRFTARSAVRNDAHKLRRLVAAELSRPPGPATAPDSPAARRMAAYRRGAPLGVGALLCAATGQLPQSALLFTAFAWMERDLLRYLAAEEGLGFAAACLPILAVERCTAVVAGAAGALDYARDRAASRWTAAKARQPTAS